MALSVCLPIATLRYVARGLTVTVFGVIYALTCLRQSLSKRGKPDPVLFNSVQFARDIANDIAQDAEEEFRRATGQTQR